MVVVLTFLIMLSLANGYVPAVTSYLNEETENKKDMILPGQAGNVMVEKNKSLSIPVKTTNSGSIFKVGVQDTPGTLLWNRTYGKSISMTHRILQLPDGGFILGAARGANPLLLKLDANGRILWERSLDVNPRKIIQTPDGGFALVGSPYFGTDYWLVKTNANGIEEWKQNYDVGSLYSLILTMDGGFALAGSKDDHGWLVKTDASGNHQWNRTYGASGYREEFKTVVETWDGFALFGTNWQYSLTNDFWLVKTDVNGEEQWQRTYSYKYAETYAGIQTTDNGFVLIGTTFIDETDSAALLVKTDALGNAQWNRTYGDTMTEDYATSIIQTLDGGFALAGYNGTFTDSCFCYDMWLVKTNSNGVEEWRQSYGGAKDDRAWGAVQTLDGGFALAGHTESYKVIGEGWLVKTVGFATLTNPQNTTYMATRMVPLYVTNTTAISKIWWRYSNGTWSTNQNMTWNKLAARWETESLTWTDGSYQVQVFFTNSLGTQFFTTQWFIVALDTDGDGLSDSDEVDTYHTDQLVVDTDGDGLSDGVEVLTHKTDPLLVDTDDDGLSDSDELNTYKTKPKVNDTDHDGLVDGAEVNIHNTLPKVNDTDGDGLADGAEVRYGTDPLIPDYEIDHDGDGLLTRWEVEMLGTDPQNNDTDGDGLSDSTEIQIHKTNPLVEDTDGDGLSDGAEVHTYKTNPLKSDPNADTDKDGVPNRAEVETYKTNPSTNDTDGDGLSDLAEVETYPTDPTMEDTDGDGLTDLAEVELYPTDPTIADTDGDGLMDGAEVELYQTDPMLEDTDGDGLTDYVEVKTHQTNPTVVDTDKDGLTDHAEVETYQTDPRVTDTDGDGLTDGIEVIMETDPNDPDDPTTTTPETTNTETIPESSSVPDFSLKVGYLATLVLVGLKRRRYRR